MKVDATVNETKTVTQSVSLHTGGFVELQQNTDGNGYLKVHLGKRGTTPLFSEAWRYIQHANDKDNLKLLTELRDACSALLATPTQPVDVKGEK